MEIAVIVLLSALLAGVAALIILFLQSRRESGSMRDFSDIITQNQRSIGSAQTERFTRMDSELRNIRAAIDSHLANIYRNMGDISALASDVGDLKKVLANVKTRGILGEIQLGSILEDILAPEQYDANAVTVPLSRNVVEFAVKLPHDDEGFIYLPIDSKFPLDAYVDLCDAYDSGDEERTEAAGKALVRRIKLFARDIHSKYVEPPYTTDFAIMFLPTEGLYLEAVKRGLVEMLQREYKVCIAGPSTMAALLNSLRVGFKTIAIEKRSGEVWRILNEISAEFEKFKAALETAQKHISQAGSDLDTLVGTRMRIMEKKLRDLEKINPENSD